MLDLARIWYCLVNSTTAMTLTRLVSLNSAMKSFVMGVFFLFSIALGNYFTAQVNGYIEHQKALGADILKGANYFWFFTIVVFVTAVVYVLWSQFYRGRTYIQGDQTS